ncbi:hypothetical protein HJP15_07480 [Pseudoalteromonas sp. NEC-BIFX-2020_002]|uniref:hypothetical protein n=1 Tax=Pseudoalteromonas sp. NEC-BIFX-2020_002 TaxID=2732353 RepID=UPI00147775FB|nr:hypothetical protein [Pseudoalteromonas sp. NEC-BIFX-2020_002]NNG42759.1 hypothetical protein [Pseudoalteromonas sp. NEC-BIFX-2020_002]
MKRIFITVLALSLAGCSYFTPPRENPMLTNKLELDEDKQSGFAISATDANRRVAILNLKSGQVCVEPPPEAANTISEAFTALFEAKVEDKADIAASLSKSISQNITQLYRRTQTVQLFRDSVFALCQNALNGQLNIDKETKARISPELISKVNDNLKAINTELKGSTIALLEDDEVNLATYLEIAKIAFPEIKSGNSELLAKKDETLQIIKNELNKAEFSRQVGITLSESFTLLEKELKPFYETEKIRFLVELAKPVQVCKTTTSYTPTKADEEKKITKSEQTCELKTVENMDEIIKAFITVYEKMQEKK